MNNNITEKIFKIGNETFSKLEDLQIPPYPKYYHDTFLDILSNSRDNDVLNLSKKYNYLFSQDETNFHVKEACFNITKQSLEEFEKSNKNLKKISDESTIDIDEIKKEPSNINVTNMLSSFSSFQQEVLSELNNADETITKLKIEIEKLERESNIDPLTKTYNRRALMKDLEEILNAGKEKVLDMQFIIFDADDFKNINDTFGHVAGDKTLIFITRLIENSIRKGIRIYRYGGEEFVVLFNRSELENCEKIVQRIIKNTDESKLLYRGNTIHLTISAGITNHIPGDTVEGITERADRALYKAKQNGKNGYKVEA